VIPRDELLAHIAVARRADSMALLRPFLQDGEEPMYRASAVTTGPVKAGQSLAVWVFVTTSSVHILHTARRGAGQIMFFPLPLVRPEWVKGRTARLHYRMDGLDTVWVLKTARRKDAERLVEIMKVIDQGLLDALRSKKLPKALDNQAMDGRGVGAADELERAAEESGESMTRRRPRSKRRR
jgi:hypothetical protein